MICAQSVPALDPAAAFTALAARLRPCLLGYLAHKVGPVEAEDLTQDALLKAWRAWESFDGARPVAWLYRIATNVALDHLRHRALLIVVSLDWVDRAASTSPSWSEPLRAPDPSPEASVLAGEAAHALEALVAASLPREAAAVLLRAGGANYDEIAAASGTTRAAVKSLLHRVRPGLQAGAAAAGYGPAQIGAATATAIQPVLPWLAIHAGDLGPAQARVAAVLVATPTQAAADTGVQLAARAGVYRTTADALAARLGYRSWVRLRAALQAEIKARGTDAQEAGDGA